MARGDEAQEFAVVIFDDQRADVVLPQQPPRLQHGVVFADGDGVPRHDVLHAHVDMVYQLGGLHAVLLKDPLALGRQRAQASGNEHQPLGVAVALGELRAQVGVPYGRAYGVVVRISVAKHQHRVRHVSPPDVAFRPAYYSL